LIIFYLILFLIISLSSQGCGIIGIRRELDCMIFRSISLKKLGCLILTVLLICITASCGSQLLMENAAKVELRNFSESNGLYNSVCYNGNDYIAVGTNGRIDRIKPDKSVTTLPAVTSASLNDVISMNGIDVAVGDSGVVLVAKDGGNFSAVKSKTSKSLYGITVYKGKFWAAGAEGTIICSSDGKHWKSINSGIKSDIHSIAANEENIMAVAGESQVLMSVDGEKWDLLDYNEYYKGLAEPCRFRSVQAVADSFFVLGEHLNIPGSPAIMSTVDGKIWMDHALNMINEMPPEQFFPLTVNAIAVDSDQLVVACNDGKILTMPNCSTCNKLDIVCSKNINDIESANGLFILVGDDFWFDILQPSDFRQYNISAVQALEDYYNGAYIVDVRSDDEYSQLHITGSIHIPVDEIETKLEEMIPDKSSEIIFYCAKGVRAQKALEKALLMGYKKVYNLGGIDAWPYDTETGSFSGSK